MTAEITPITAAKPKAVSVTDARGRIITLKKPTALAQYRIVEVAGTGAANPTYMAMVLPLIFVTSIDADPIPQPGTKMQLEGLISRLDEDGIAAVMKGVRDEFTDAEESAEAVAP